MKLMKIKELIIYSLILSLSLFFPIRYFFSSVERSALLLLWYYAVSASAFLYVVLFFVETVSSFIRAIQGKTPSQENKKPFEFRAMLPYAVLFVLFILVWLSLRS